MGSKLFKKQFSIGEILLLSWVHFLKNFKSIFLVSFIIYVPLNIFVSFILIFVSDVTEFEAFWSILQGLKSCIGVLASIAIAFIIRSSVKGKIMSYKVALKKSFSKWGIALGTSFIAGVFVLGLLFLLIVPGVIFAVFWSFTIFAIIFKDLYGMRALDYSKSVVKGRWWTVFGYSLVFAFVFLFVILFLELFFFFIPQSALFEVVSRIIIDVFVSFFIIISSIFFINFDATRI